MKSILLSALLALGAPAYGAVLFFDLNNLVIPLDMDNPDNPANFIGVYINVLTGESRTSEPGDFNDAPWINFFAGGQGISTSALLRPLSNQTSGTYDPENGGYFVNVQEGTVIDSSLTTFVVGESVSIFHLAEDPEEDQFESGVRGFLAFEYQASAGGGTSYGWLSITPNTGGPGFAVDVVYSDTPGEALITGAIPEPSTCAAIAGAIMFGAVGLRRRRTR